MLDLLFVGEKPSRTAHEKGYTWADGRLASRTLTDALDAVGIPEGSRAFLNLFGDHPDNEEAETARCRRRLGRIRREAEGRTIVGMGRKVCGILEAHGIPHVAIVHPAAAHR